MLGLFWRHSPSSSRICLCCQLLPPNHPSIDMSSTPTALPASNQLICETLSVSLPSTCRGIGHHTMLTEITLSRPYHCYPVHTISLHFLCSDACLSFLRATIHHSKEQLTDTLSIFFVFEAQPAVPKERSQNLDPCIDFLFSKKSTTGSCGNDSVLSIATVFF
jgi:hypothetical protein